MVFWWGYVASFKKKTKVLQARELIWKNCLSESFEKNPSAFTKEGDSNLLWMFIDPLVAKTSQFWALCLWAHLSGNIWPFAVNRSGWDSKKITPKCLARSKCFCAVLTLGNMCSRSLFFLTNPWTDKRLAPLCCYQQIWLFGKSEIVPEGKRTGSTVIFLSPNFSSELIK